MEGFYLGRARAMTGDLESRSASSIDSCRKIRITEVAPSHSSIFTGILYILKKDSSERGQKMIPYVPCDNIMENVTASKILKILYTNDLLLETPCL